MSTTAVVPATSSELLTDKTTYRAYVKFKEDGTIDKIQAKAQVKDDENWKKLEAEGWVLFNQNDFIRYTVKSRAAIDLLVPDEAQQVYIFQAGLNYVQNAKANKLSVEVKEGTDTTTVQAEPVSNDEEIDLREYINEAPERRMLSPLEKAQKLFAGLNMSEDAKKALLLQLAEQFAAQAAASQVEEVEEGVQA
jgi:hypothetical protein